MAARTEKYQCECGSIIEPMSKYSHKKTQKHKRYEVRVERLRVQESREQLLRAQEAPEENEYYEQNARGVAHDLYYDSHLQYEMEQFQEQIREFRRYEEQKAEEQKAELERINKRSMPKHIVDLVFDKLEDKTCVICFEDVTKQNVFMTKCGHVMCTSCEKRLQGTNCPTCRSEL